MVNETDVETRLMRKSGGGHRIFDKARKFRDAADDKECATFLALTRGWAYASPLKLFDSW